ncbi:AbrB/MazE/SpoVT family DNA-binding domain-containing protein [Candidatus Pacearchaeota archaeon]|nr:AbrB/MazE/SpoVT family DNA-binding domain-containing protein [Candidatus Pacearchaeota archaeon]
MPIETVKMSSKGQIVIPQHIREKLNAEEGSIFVIVEERDSVILKKIEIPSKELLIKELKKIASEGSKRAKSLGIKETDVTHLIHKLRKEKSVK